MDGNNFDNLARAIARPTSRRGVLKVLAGSVAGGVLGWRQEVTAAFICRQAGVLCANDAQCCSGDCGGDHRCACPNGGLLCERTCVDASNDVANCGGCGHSCGTDVVFSTPTCVNQACGFVCDAGYHLCAGACAIDDSAIQCGVECTDCRAAAPANTVASCGGGSCQYSCDTAREAFMCGSACCASGQRCTDATTGTCCTQESVAAACGTRECGSTDDNCGQSVRCGTCDASQCLTCSNGACVLLTCPTGQTLNIADCACGCANTCQNLSTLNADCTCTCIEGCFNGGTLNPDECTCECTNICLNGGTLNADCSCVCKDLAEACANGGFLIPADCSCKCPGSCQHGGTQNPDCSCACADFCIGGFTREDCSCDCSPCINGGTLNPNCTCNCPVCEGGVAPGPHCECD